MTVFAFTFYSSLPHIPYNLRSLNLFHCPHECSSIFLKALVLSCIATGYGLDGPGIESRWGRDFPHLSRPALGPTQPPVQWVPGSFPGVKSVQGVTLTPHPLLLPWSRKSRAIPLLPLWAIWPVQSLSACTREHFTSTLP